jgi:hypothetical protein
MNWRLVMSLKAVVAALFAVSAMAAAQAVGAVALVLAPPVQWGSFGSAIEANGDDAFVAAYRQSGAALLQGAVYGVDFTQDAVTGSIIAPEPQAQASFGAALSLGDDGKLLIGEPGRDAHDGSLDSVGAAYLYGAGGNLIATLTPPEDHVSQFAYFGFGVQLAGAYAAVIQQHGLHIYDSSTGTRLRTIDVDPGGSSYSLRWPLGTIGGDLLAANGGNGIVRLDPATGGLVRSYITGGDCVACNWAVASNSDTVAVARYAGGAESPEVFLFDAATAQIRSRIPIRELTPSGIALDMTDDYLAIGTYYDQFGAPWPQQDRGLAEVYRVDDGRLVGSFVSPASEYYNDWFGSDVALLGDRLAVGARWDNVGGAEDGGAVYVFPLNAPADWTRDGYVDGADFLAWQRQLGVTGDNLPGDGDADGDVDGADLTVWRERFNAEISQVGSTLARGATVPEPDGALLAAAAFLASHVARGISKGRRPPRRANYAWVQKFSATAVSCVAILTAKYGFAATVFQLGADDGSVADFHEESRSSNPPPGGLELDDDFYVGQEPLTHFERALTTADPVNRIHWTLSSLHAQHANRFTLLFGAQFLVGSNVVDVLFNDVVIANDVLLVSGRNYEMSNLSAAHVGAVTGENLITFERVGGVGEWVNLDFVWLSVFGPLAADFDFDGTVDAADRALWRMAFASSDAGDADEDSDSDGNDLLIWQRNLGTTPATPATQPVPEPRAWMLMAFVARFCAARRLCRNWSPRGAACGRRLGLDDVVTELGGARRVVSG